MNPLTRISFALICAFCLAQSISIRAQSPADLTLAAGSMPAWTVPVLRLVSATHVEPTTGVVLTDSGMVLIPADFAGPGDEIIVLDGGTDIIRHGRPAKIVHRFTSEGLQIISVPTLRRNGAAFSASDLEDGAGVRLTAFPPAELIAEGKPPVEIDTTVRIPSENGQPMISGETPLPKVSGALVDACGNLAGYSSANGVQSMSTAGFPRYQWKDTLQRLMEEIQVTVRVVDCRLPTERLPGEAPPPEPEIIEKPASEPDPEPEKADEEPPRDPEETEPEISDEAVETPEEDTGNVEPAEEETLDEIELLPPNEEPVVEGDSPEPNSTDTETASGNAGWYWLIGALVLLGGGIYVHYLRNRGRTPHGDDLSTRPQPLPITDEDVEIEPVTPGLDSELLVFGEFTDGASFEARCPVSSHAINLIIGRGQADIAIESAAVSRQHASLNGTADALTLSDLGSSNGTTINGVPCLEGETMFVNPGDVIMTGNARFHYRIVSNSTDQESG